MILLAELPLMHPLRNQPLVEIGATYRWKQGGPWKEVKPSYRISQCTYNDLGPAWTEPDDWAVPG